MTTAPHAIFICTDSDDSGNYSIGKTPTEAWENYREYHDESANIDSHTFYKAVEIDVELSIVEVEKVVQV